jgi:hypothetical protein
MNRGVGTAVLVVGLGAGVKRALELALLGRVDVKLAPEVPPNITPHEIVVYPHGRDLVVADRAAHATRTVAVRGPEVIDDLTEIVSSLLPSVPTSSGHTTAA